MNPLEVFQAIGSIDDQHVLVFRNAVYQQVIDDASLAIGHAAVLDFARGEFAGVVAGDVLNQIQRLGTSNTKLAHVRNIKHTTSFSHGVVLND